LVWVSFLVVAAGIILLFQRESDHNHALIVTGAVLVLIWATVQIIAVPRIRARLQAFSDTHPRPGQT
jgi:hypothetical protein